jgi:segregation and condensation protein B
MSRTFPAKTAMDDNREPGLKAPVSAEELADPADHGLSLEELGQAYAAALGKGADPYAEPAPVPVAQPLELLADLPDGIAADDDEESCEITPRSILEAILFVGHPTGEPLTSERIAALMRGVRPAEVDELVQDLNEEYAARDAAYTIVSVGPGYQMVVRQEFAPLRDHFYGKVREARLSPQSIEILAIVAYQQPIATDQIDRLRGKPSGAVLSQLLRRDLLRLERPQAKHEKPVYRTTDRFLDLFGLESLEELPRSQELEREL